jgi:hypothetical protein
MMLTAKKKKYSEKHYPAVLISTTDSTLTGLGLNPGFCIKRPATKLLDHGTAFFV